MPQVVLVAGVTQQLRVLEQLLVEQEQQVKETMAGKAVVVVLITALAVVVAQEQWVAIIA
jgi:predicted lysophospholipase L1 biosynthesis ABC-type transport system permease subunit